MEAPLRYADVASPIGSFRVVYRDRQVFVVDLLERGVAQSGAPPEARKTTAPFDPDSPPGQLRDYFRGKRTDFNLDTNPSTASEFDQGVYDALVRVNAGSVVTYGELARAAGHPGAARAVGGAMHRNPIPIVIPCHRVVGEEGTLTGYGLGLWRKRWLLDHEGAWPLRSGTAEGPKGRAQRTLDPVREPRRTSEGASESAREGQPA